MLRLVDFLGMILDNVYSGIIVCDRNCRIVFMNSVYGELLGIDPKEAVGKHIEEYFPNSRLSNVVSSGLPELGQRCSLRTEALLLVNRIPLKHNGRVSGVILQTIFRDYRHFTDLVKRLNLLEREVQFQKQALETVFSPKYDFDSIIGESVAIKSVITLAQKFSQTDSPVLILGQTGTGKELFAHAIHASSKLSIGPFVCLNCATVPKDLLESELFGYEPGAFTGAKKSGKPGQIELANGGTLFLDEIGELPVNAQAKLLRVAEEKTLIRLGGIKSREVEFRLIAATNRDLRAMIQKGEFREDLYFRLNTMTVDIPPLSQRSGDILPLIRHFLRARGRSECRVSDEALSLLEKYTWPGNVRELKNVIDRALSLACGTLLQPEHLPPDVLGLICSGEVSGKLDSTLVEEVSRFEKTLLVRAVEVTRGNMSKAAKLLGISRSSLYEKFQKYNLIHPGNH
jgi:transcriptional regulator with PAS, ATPase and Fis domain